VKLKGGKSTDVRKRKRTSEERSGLARRSRASKSSGSEGAACWADAAKLEKSAPRNRLNAKKPFGVRDARLDCIIVIVVSGLSAKHCGVGEMYQSHAWRGICMGVRERMTLANSSASKTTSQSLKITVIRRLVLARN
jgi:hypothetical protein